MMSHSMSYVGKVANVDQVYVQSSESPELQDIRERLRALEGAAARIYQLKDLELELAALSSHVRNLEAAIRKPQVPQVVQVTTEQKTVEVVPVQVEARIGKIHIYLWASLIAGWAVTIVALMFQVIR